MKHVLSCALSTLLVVALLSGPAIAAGKAGDAASAGDQRRMLNEGYSMLHRDMSHAKHADKILLVKFETESVGEIVTAISHYSKRLHHDLEHLATQYPALDVHLEPLPEIEIRKRFSIGMDRAIENLPLVGASQQEFERTMLISLSNALNHWRHLCKVMAKEEPQPELREFLLKNEKELDGLYDQTMNLLRRDYFKPDPEQK